MSGSLLHTHQESGLKCHRCDRDLVWHLPTAQYGGQLLQINVRVNDHESVPREHYGDLPLCNRCFAIVGKILAMLVEGLDRPGS